LKPPSPSRHDNVRRYGLAIIAAIIALIARRLLAPLLGEENPYHTVWAAVVFSAWYCGIGPAIITSFVGLLGVWYWFLPLVGSFRLENPKFQIAGMIGFLFFSGLIIALGEGNRRSLARSRWAEKQLQATHDELERNVEERTADLSVANENLRDLSGRLQQMRDEERRQIARELHDSVGQILAALSMNIDVVRSQSHKLDERAARAAHENAHLVQEVATQIRTISYLLHPPVLELAGLASALRWYVDGFSERSKIKVDLDIPDDFSRLPDEVEIAVFRMVQECLTNIHRHSGATSAQLRIRHEGERFLVEVRDHGKGIPLERQLELSSSGRTGVGFRGMRERLRQLGGSLDIQSNGDGTIVSATLPVPHDSSPSVSQQSA